MTTNHLHETMFENGFLPSAMSSITETTSTYLSNKPRTCKFRGKRNESQRTHSKLQLDPNVTDFLSPISIS